MTATQPLGVLFLCTGNSARSQIAEAILITKGRGRFRVGSAGTKPAAQVNPGAIEVLRDHGIDWTGHRPKTIDEIRHEPWDLVITVCDDAKETCPVFPGHPPFAHWGMPDPANVEPAEARGRAFRETYQALNARIDLLQALLREGLAQRIAELQLGAIGKPRDARSKLP